MTVNPATYNITLQRRADYSVLLQFKDSTGANIDLTNYTVEAQAWDKERENKSAEFDVQYTKRDEGKVTLKLSADETATFAASELYYDVLVTDTINDIKSYYLEGVILVSEGYTGPEDTGEEQ